MNKIEKLKNDIKAVIKTNGNQEITAQMLQDILVKMIDTAYEKFEEPIFKVVTELPTEDIEINTVYLVANKDSKDITDKFIEYTYINNSWEKLGEFKAEVDLSNIEKTLETKADLDRSKNVKIEQLTPAIIYDKETNSINGSFETITLDKLKIVKSNKPINDYIGHSYQYYDKSDSLEDDEAPQYIYDATADEHIEVTETEYKDVSFDAFNTAKPLDLTHDLYLDNEQTGEVEGLTKLEEIILCDKDFFDGYFYLDLSDSLEDDEAPQYIYDATADEHIEVTETEYNDVSFDAFNTAKPLDLTHDLYLDNEQTGEVKSIIKNKINDNSILLRTAYKSIALINNAVNISATQNIRNYTEISNIELIAIGNHIIKNTKNTANLKICSIGGLNEIHGPISVTDSSLAIFGYNNSFTDYNESHKNETIKIFGDKNTLSNIGNEPVNVFGCYNNLSSVYKKVYIFGNSNELNDISNSIHIFGNENRFFNIGSKDDCSIIGYKNIIGGKNLTTDRCNIFGNNNSTHINQRTQFDNIPFVIGQNNSIQSFAYMFGLKLYIQNIKATYRLILGFYNDYENDKAIYQVGGGIADNHRLNLEETLDINNQHKKYIYGVGGYDGTNSSTTGVKSLQEVLDSKLDGSTKDNSLIYFKNYTDTNGNTVKAYIGDDSKETQPMLGMNGLAVISSTSDNKQSGFAISAFNFTAVYEGNVSYAINQNGIAFQNGKYTELLAANGSKIDLSNIFSFKDINELNTGNIGFKGKIQPVNGKYLEANISNGGKNGFYKTDGTIFDMYQYTETLYLKKLFVSRNSGIECSGGKPTELYATDGSLLDISDKIHEKLDNITEATTADEVVTKFNALLADLKAKGFMKSE